MAPPAPPLGDLGSAGTASEGLREDLFEKVGQRKHHGVLEFSHEVLEFSEFSMIFVGISFCTLRSTLVMKCGILFMTCWIMRWKMKVLSTPMIKLLLQHQFGICSKSCFFFNQLWGVHKISTIYITLSCLEMCQLGHTQRKCWKCVISHLLANPPEKKKVELNKT